MSLVDRLNACILQVRSVLGLVPWKQTLDFVTSTTYCTTSTLVIKAWASDKLQLKHRPVKTPQADWIHVMLLCMLQHTSPLVQKLGNLTMNHQHVCCVMTKQLCSKALHNLLFFRQLQRPNCQFVCLVQEQMFLCEFDKANKHTRVDTIAQTE